MHKLAGDTVSSAWLFTFSVGSDSEGKLWIDGMGDVFESSFLPHKVYMCHLVELRTLATSLFVH